MAEFRQGLVYGNSTVEMHKRGLFSIETQAKGHICCPQWMSKAWPPTGHALV
jgi:hypothetical protein